MTTSTLRRRLDRIPIPQPDTNSSYDFSRLTDAQFDRLAALREQLMLVGVDGLTAEEMEEIAGLVARMTEGTAG